MTLPAFAMTPTLAELPFNLLDWFLFFILALFLVSGYRKGLLWQALAIVGVIASFVVAGRYHAALAETSVFEGIRSHSAQAALVTAFLVIFIAMSFFTGLLAAWIGRRLRERGLGSIDKGLGAVVGLAKGVVLLGGIAIGLQQWALPQGIALPADVQQKADTAVGESWLVPRLADSCIYLIDQIPQAERDEIAKFWNEQKEVFFGKNEEAAGAGEGSESGTEGTESSPLGTQLSADPSAGGVKPNQLTDSTPGTASSATGEKVVEGAQAKKPARKDEVDIITRLAEKPGGRLPDLGTLRRLTAESGAARLRPAASSKDSGSLVPGTARDGDAKPATSGKD